MKIPFGLRVDDQRMVDPTEVQQGQKCGCICPGCGSALIAKHGNILEWHFAHKSGAECSSGVESAVHRMAKQMVIERSQIWVPERKFTKELRGPYDDIDGSYSWKETLSIVVCTEGLKNLTECLDEKQVETRRPDILANLDGKPIAIEIASTHFCDHEKLNWLKTRNLTTLEVDIGILPSTQLSADVPPVFSSTRV